MTDWTRFSNPCDPGLLVPGKQVRFQVDEAHHAHGCVETVLYGGAWVKLDNGEKMFVQKGKMLVENPVRSNPTGSSAALTGVSCWAVRYVHKIAPSPKDVGPSVALPDAAFSNRNTLGAALRQAGVLMAGGRVRDFRVEGDKVVVFPSVPGMTTYWHSIILTHEGS